MPVHVSLHDVSPLFSDEIRTALELCDAAGVRPALLVVPNFHGRAPLATDDAFCGRLRDLQARGHEVFLHGFFHQRRGDRHSEAPASVGRARGILRATRGVRSGRGRDGADVAPEEARRRIEDGERVLKAAGLRIDGFVAPAWSMPRWLMPLLAERRFRFTEDHMRVYDPVLDRAAERRPQLGHALPVAPRIHRRLVPRGQIRACSCPCTHRHPPRATCASWPSGREVERLPRWAEGDFVESSAGAVRRGLNSQLRERARVPVNVPGNRARKLPTVSASPRGSGVDNVVGERHEGERELVDVEMFVEKLLLARPSAAGHPRLRAASGTGTGTGT